LNYTLTISLNNVYSLNLHTHSPTHQFTQSLVLSSYHPTHPIIHIRTYSVPLIHSHFHFIRRTACCQSQTCILVTFRCEILTRTWRSLSRAERVILIFGGQDVRRANQGIPVVVGGTGRSDRQCDSSLQVASATV